MPLRAELPQIQVSSVPRKSDIGRSPNPRDLKGYYCKNSAMIDVDEAGRPYYDVLNLSFDAWATQASILCRGTLFNVEIESTDLDLTPHLKTYKRLINRKDSDGGNTALCKWIFDKIYPFTSTLSLDYTAVTLQNRYFPPTYYLYLTVVNGTVVAKPMDDARKRRFSLEPDVVMPSKAIPSALRVPRVKASDIFIVQDTTSPKPIFAAPTVVCGPDGIPRFFKACRDPTQMAREMKISIQLRTYGLYGKLRVSRLISTVVSEDGQRLLGLLFELIPARHHDLYEVEALETPELFSRWESQLEFIIQTLHDYGIVWGDVHPGNVVIDTHGDAWVVDFGGGLVDFYVPEELQCSKEGDWAGCKRIFQELRRCSGPIGFVS